MKARLPSPKGVRFQRVIHSNNLRLWGSGASRPLPIRVIAICLFASVCVGAKAHDSLSADAVQAYLARVTELQSTLGSGNSAESRAQASLQLGRTLDDIRETFNRDIESHGKVQGLSSNLLISELAKRGAPLAFSARNGRFTANLGYFRDALSLAPTGPIAGDASFRLLAGYFHDSMGDDPLQPVSQSPTQLNEQIRLGEFIRRNYPQHAQRDEGSFILAICYMQAARAALDRGARSNLLRSARDIVTAYVKDYRESFRATALTTLLDSFSGEK